jgi:hypothetical protein
MLLTLARGGAGERLEFAATPCREQRCRLACWRANSLRQRGTGERSLDSGGCASTGSLANVML